MPAQSPEGNIQAGQLRPTSAYGKFNSMSFMVQQALNKMQTATLVRIDAVTNAGGLSPVGFVDVTPLVNQLDGEGNPTPHITVYGLPYFRLQGGANAIILDPQVGDIGICVFASRDISKVKSTKKQSNPGSFRQYNFSDGMYIGGVLNGTPSQYVQFSTAGIKIHSPVAVILDAPDVQIIANTVEITAQTVTTAASTSATVTTPIFTVNGNVAIAGGITQTGGGAAHLSGSLQVDGTATVTGDVTAAGTSVHTHVHNDPQGGTTSAPI